MRSRTQFERAEAEKKNLFDRELQNIEELEADERAATVPDPNSNDLLFGVSSEQFVFPEGFDWSLPLGQSVGGTPPDVLHSSPQGS